MPWFINYCGIVTFLAMSTFQVLKATTMTSVMFLQDLKSKNTQVSRAKALGQCAQCIIWQCLTVLFLYALVCTAPLDFTGQPFWISRPLDFWISRNRCGCAVKYRYVQSSADHPAARLMLPLLGLCTENEQTHPSLSHPQSSVWHQQISSKIFLRVTKQ